MKPNRKTSMLGALVAVIGAPFAKILTDHSVRKATRKSETSQHLYMINKAEAKRQRKAEKARSIHG